MLDDILRLFQQSVSAFRSELNIRDPEDQVAELLSSMRRELVVGRAAISALEADHGKSRAEAEAERTALEQCERRGALAEGIGDAQTARVASDFATRHREKIAILEQKSLALEAEIALRRRESDEMTQQFKEADANRFILLAQLKRAGAREAQASSFSADVDPFSEMSRMEERIWHDADYISALDELDDAPPPPPAVDGNAVEERLRELKRQMGRE